ncbi:MAG: rRNA maturation RNase YbeY [Gemmatimonadaceae bacterium]
MSSEGTRAPLPPAAVDALVRYALARRRVRHAIISVAFVSNRRIAALNRQILGRAGTTDVLALAFRRRSERDPVIGDIYIAADVVRMNARAAGIPARVEAARVVLHGLLHTLGLDHPEVAREKSAMWRTQERLLMRSTQDRVW